MRTKKGDLSWIQTGPLESQVRPSGDDDGTALGTLKWANRWSSLAFVKTGAGDAWTLKRVGFLHPRVTIHRDGYDSEVASGTMRGLGLGSDIDTLVFADDGVKYSLNRTGRRSWSLSRDGRSVLTVTPSITCKDARAQVLIGQDDARIILLSAITWYAILLTTYDSWGDASGGVVAAVVAATA